MKTNINARINIPNGYFKILTKGDKARLIISSKEEKITVDCDVAVVKSIGESINKWIEAEYIFYGDGEEDGLNIQKAWKVRKLH